MFKVAHLPPPLPLELQGRGVRVPPPPEHLKDKFSAGHSIDTFSVVIENVHFLNLVQSFLCFFLCKMKTNLFYSKLPN